MSAFSRPMQSRYSVSKSIILFLVTAPLFFAASLALTLPYQQGDQLFYRNLYEYLGDADFSEITLAQLNFTGSAEPLFGILMWVGSNSGIDKDIFVAFLNTFLCLAVLHLLVKRHANSLFIFLLFSNYYLLVLLTSAERLKLSYIIFVLAVANSSRVISVILVSFTPLLHFQSIIAISVRVIGYAPLIRIKTKIGKGSFFLALFGGPIIFIGALLFFLRFFEDLANKFTAYISSGNIFEIASIALLLIISTFVFTRKMESFLILSSCAVFAYVLGSGRVNMIAVTLFIYLVLKEKRTGNPLVLVLMAYFSFKSIGYVMRIFANGTGF